MLDELLEEFSKMSDEELENFFKDYTPEEMMDMINSVDEVLDND